MFCCCLTRTTLKASPSFGKFLPVPYKNNLKSLSEFWEMFCWFLTTSKASPSFCTTFCWFLPRTTLKATASFGKQICWFLTRTTSKASLSFGKLSAGSLQEQPYKPLRVLEKCQLVPYKNNLKSLSEFWEMFCWFLTKTALKASPSFGYTSAGSLQEQP